MVELSEIVILRVFLVKSIIRIHSFTHSFIHSFICSFAHSFIHSFVFSFVHSFAHSSISRLLRPLTFIEPSFSIAMDADKLMARNLRYFSAT